MYENFFVYCLLYLAILCFLMLRNNVYNLIDARKSTILLLLENCNSVYLIKLTCKHFNTCIALSYYIYVDI